jgi:hypothetical protein
MDSGRLQPAFFGGLLIGVLSALPIVSAGNCCCCLWIVAGGMLADIPVETRDMIERASAGGRGVVGFVFKFLVMLITGTIFGMLGGLLGVAVFKKDAPPPPPPGTVEILPPE